MPDRHPVDGSLHLAVARSRAAARVGVVAAVQFNYVTIIVLHDVVATNDVSAAQSHLAAGLQAEKLAWRLFHEVVLLDPDFS